MPVASNEIARSPGTWCFVQISDGEVPDRVLPIPNRTFVAGRGADTDLAIAAVTVSKHHARFFYNDGILFIEDLGSTNGSFVNGKPVVVCALYDGDLLQLGSTLFRVHSNYSSAGDATVVEVPVAWAQALLTFDDFIANRRVTPHYQPIISLEQGHAVAYEVLARSEVQALATPDAMFGAAERLGQQAALSELMREEGLRVATNSSIADAQLFLNTHPCEIINDRFTQSLTELRRQYPATNIVIEIHESAVTDLQSIRNLKQLLLSLDMRMSYDDFGAGQTRLCEIGEVPPDVLKFDMTLIRNIDKAPATRQEVLRSLVRMAIDLGTTPLVEGIETPAEHEVCRQIGFQLGQGFLYGRPASVTRLNPSVSWLDWANDSAKR